MLLSAVVDRGDRQPRDGFYALGRELGFEFDYEVEFWREQRDEVHRLWGDEASGTTGTQAT